MIQNRLITTQGNYLDFYVEHKSSGEEYNLKEGERYFVNIAKADSPQQILISATSPMPTFTINMSHLEGEYIFEVGIEEADSHRQVILPALDEKNRPINQLLVLKRLEEI